LANPELYNLENDPAETTDVAASYPDVVASITARVQALLLTFPSTVQSVWQNTMSQAPVYCPSGGWPAGPGP
jgi:hypothetical protein